MFCSEFEFSYSSQNPAVLTSRSITWGSSTTSNYYTSNEVVIVIKYSLIHYVTILFPGYQKSESISCSDVCQVRCQLRYVSYVMFLFNPNVTYLEYNLSSTAGHNDGSLGRWLVTRWYSTQVNLCQYQQKNGNSPPQKIIPNTVVWGTTTSA